MNELNELMQKVNKFRDDRNWRQFHNEKDLTISINLEASELLELFQWQTSEETVQENLPELKEELADVLIYSFMLADNLDLDIKEIMEAKLKLDELKYPVEKSKNSSKKYDEL